MPRRNKAGKKEARQQRAKKRADARKSRTPQEQWDVLDAKLGKGAGAQKERARLLEASRMKGG